MHCARSKHIFEGHLILQVNRTPQLRPEAGLGFRGFRVQECNVAGLRV